MPGEGDWKEPVGRTRCLTGSMPARSRQSSRPPRVLVLSENESVPSDRRVWDVCRTLTNAGCEVHVVCPQGAPGERAGSEMREGVSIHRFPLRFASGGAAGYLREYATAMWRMWRLVGKLSAQGPFDAVHACNPPDFLLLAAWPARRRGARFLFDHHDLTPELLQMRLGQRHRLLHRLALLVERGCFALADVVISTNESYRRIALERAGKPPERVFVVRNGPDLRRLQALAPDPALKRGRPLLIGYVGVMAPQDGVDHALHALARLADRQDWHAVFAGDGQSREQLIALARTLGLEDRVELCGWLEDEQIARLLSSCDVCLAPEPSSPLNELSTMVKIAEYMAASRPVVAYDLQESRFTAGRAALYARPDDPACFAACIEHLLERPKLREAMGRIGRERVERELSWERSERNLLAAYRAILGDFEQRLPAPAPRAAVPVP